MMAPKGSGGRPLPDFDRAWKNVDVHIERMTDHHVWIGIGDTALDFTVEDGKLHVTPHDGLMLGGLRDV